MHDVDLETFQRRFGARIREWRLTKRPRPTQRQIAKAIGLSPSRYSELERGDPNANPTISTILPIATFFGKKLVELLDFPETRLRGSRKPGKRGRPRDGDE